MATIDIIILAMIGVGVIMGLIKGFVKQMASIVGLIAGLLMARADRKSTRLNSSHASKSRMPSSA